ncbi:exo-alpha-sialidase [Corynebacterium mendelii]|uniref:exo-alpha-sialidase n=1 Tax=Corynebacterium mendelii TaxID=2765362 RepID=A0A939DZJ5_9CORY|nr:sialidase family protein [Corynebacterium mendelii]MBN9643709.1 exo-alpha-sialidase [Corynebacterium mendelii]
MFSVAVAEPFTGSSTISFDFSTTTDTDLVALGGDTYGWVLKVAASSLLLEGETITAPVFLDMEDTVNVRDGATHSVAIVSGPAGSRIFLDGYQCFSSTANLSPDEVVEGDCYRMKEAPGLSITQVRVHNEQLSPEAVLARAVEPEPMIEFAASGLAPYDVENVGELRTGTVFARYRTRGRGQGGVILAASGAGREQLRLSVDEDGILYEVEGTKGRLRSFRASGSFDGGEWVDVAIRVARGAVDIYVDGYLEAHCPGVAFFNDVTGIDRVVIGQDTQGLRLFGEVRNAAIFDTALNDAQIKRLSGVVPVDTACLFDRGFHGSVSYRIPSLLTTASGVVIAGADQRETVANDAPNSINFVIRRSFDSGRTWDNLQQVISYPGEGQDGASVIDSCPVQDINTGRIFVVIDHFPGGVGQPNNEPGIGVDNNGRFELFDAAGVAYTWEADGTVTVTDTGELTEFKVADNGDVTVGADNQPGGNVFLCDGVDPNQTLLTARTSFLQIVHSDDDGASWSAPRNLNHQVKEEWMPFLGTGPGNGIQLTHGPHAGRLLIPVYYNTANRRSFSCAVIYSDDGGNNWKRGCSPNDGRIFNNQVINSKDFTDEQAATHEATVIERLDGSVLMLMRNQNEVGKVAQAVSEDGGQTWSEVSFVDDIDEIFCQPNCINAPTATHPERIIFANAAQLMPYRGRGVLRVSDDGGRSWVARRTFNPAHYVYQCMTQLPTGEIGLLWERETQGLYFSILPNEWFDNAR